MVNALDELRARISRLMGKARYEHTLGVERMAQQLGEVFLPDKIEELRAAALLHDVAKELPYEDQIALISEYGISVSDEDLTTPPALHSFAACAVIKRDFPNYSTAEIISAVYNHTLGDPDMSLFDKLIYISDYIEEGRQYQESARVRSYLLSSLTNSTNEEKVSFLNNAILMSIDNTIERLSALGKPINSKTLLTKSALTT